jgi:hypothetical protein
MGFENSCVIPETRRIKTEKDVLICCRRVLEWYAILAGPRTNLSQYQGHVPKHAILEFSILGGYYFSP